MLSWRGKKDEKYVLDWRNRLKAPAYSCGRNLAWKINLWFRSALGKTATFFRNIRFYDALIFHPHSLTNSGSSSPHELADAHQSKCKEITPAVSSSSCSCIHGVYWPRGRLWCLIILPGDWCVVRPCGFCMQTRRALPLIYRCMGLCHEYAKPRHAAADLGDWLSMRSSPSRRRSLPAGQSGLLGRGEHHDGVFFVFCFFFPAGTDAGNVSDDDVLITCHHASPSTHTQKKNLLPLLTAPARVPPLPFPVSLSAR